MLTYRHAQNGGLLIFRHFDGKNAALLGSLPRDSAELNSKG
jgi:hypothetical protein